MMVFMLESVMQWQWQQQRQQQQCGGEHAVAVVVVVVSIEPTHCKDVATICMHANQPRLGGDR